MSAAAPASSEPALLTPELLRNVRRLQIISARRSQEFLAGPYHSAFKGRGVEFDEVREYEPGDDVRTIEWNVTARAGRPFVKTFREERALSIVLAVDVSGSQDFGSQRQFKRELAAELAATLAVAAAQNSDQAGLLLFSDRVEHFLPPRRGMRHVLRLLRMLLTSGPHGAGTDLGVALEHLRRILRRRAIIFLVSDFLYPPALAGRLGLVHHRHDLIPVMIGDARERALPPAGWVEFADPESGARTVLHVTRRVRRRFAAEAGAATATWRAEFRRRGLDFLECRTGEPFLPGLLQFFERRSRRR